MCKDVNFFKLISLEQRHERAHVQLKADGFGFQGLVAAAETDPIEREDLEALGREKWDDLYAGQR